MRTITINNERMEVPAGAIAYKYADPVEDARWLFDEGDMAEIKREDPGLVVEVNEEA